MTYKQSTICSASTPSHTQLGFSIWTSCSSAAYASPAIDTTRFVIKACPAKVASSDGWFCASDEPRLPPRHRFLRHLTVPSQWSQDFAAAIGVLPVLHRQRPDPPQHLAKQAPVQMSLGQPQTVVPRVLDQSSTSLHQPLLQAGERPTLDPQGQRQPPSEVPQVVGEHTRPQPYLVTQKTVPNQ